MSQQLMEHPGQSPTFPRSSHPNPPSSKTSGKKEDTSSTKSRKKSGRSLLSFLKKGSKTSLHLDPPSPVPSSPSENPESLSSSIQTLQPTMMTTGPIPPQTPNMSSGSAIINTASPLNLSPHNPLPTYNELIQQVAKLRQEKSLRDSSQKTMRSSAPLPVTEPSLSSIAAQLAQDYRQRQAPSIGHDSRAAASKLTPSTMPTQKSDYRMNQIEQELPGISLDTWMEQRAHTHTNEHDLPGAGGQVYEYLVFQEGQAWRLADPAEQEDILSHSADVQATILFNQNYPCKGRVKAGSGGADARGSGKPADKPDEDKEDDDEKGKKPEDQPWQLGTGFFKGDKPPTRYADPIARNVEQWSLPGAPNKFDPE
ncbi:hypothetical protein ARMSODRAFT_977515 [Armillaria solidipes]|uniref:Uncharacterized protein n=1 Tax=Armillaria solidipes TaxID=1076256 RepID=A0A2H3BAB2_9AGAR|nr:hypothetical protein ARMSODRAFT_977515 [Armillaria solidipes]